MQTVMISGALFFVMILLLLVVYDSNPTVQRIVGKFWPFRMTPAKQGHKEAPMNNNEDHPAAPPATPGSPTQASRWRRRLFPFPRRHRESHGSVASPSPVEKVELPPAETANIPPQAPMHKGKAEALSELQETIGNLTGRLSQAETAIEKIAHLEGEVTRVAEATEIVSQDFKDILGSLRSTIDGFESRLNAMSAQLEEVRQSAPSAQAPAARAELDEETRGRIKSLEKAVADMAETIRSLPDDVRRALSNSRKAAGEAEELGKRLEIISSNLQMTLGYGIKKAFRCDSCGSQGFVASRVVCSKCGTASWWGWWPVNEETAENDADETIAGMDDFGVTLESEQGSAIPENIEPSTQTGEQ